MLIYLIRDGVEENAKPFLHVCHSVNLILDKGLLKFHSSYNSVGNSLKRVEILSYYLLMLKKKVFLLQVIVLFIDHCVKHKPLDISIFSSSLHTDSDYGYLCSPDQDIGLTAGVIVDGNVYSS